MSASDVRSETAKTRTVDMKLEIVVIPVSDVDRAKRFYDTLGWRLDADFAAGDDFAGLDEAGLEGVEEHPGFRRHQAAAGEYGPAVDFGQAPIRQDAL